MTEQEGRAAIVREANTWLHTPFRHMARVKGPRGGVDCGQILCAVFEDAGVLPHVSPKPYSMQYHLHRDKEWYLDYLNQHMKPIPEQDATTGDVVIFKVGRTFSHAAILLDQWPGKIIHAVTGIGVIYSHGTKEAILQRRERRFFSLWAKSNESSQQPADHSKTS